LNNPAPVDNPAPVNTTAANNPPANTAHPAPLRRIVRLFRPYRWSLLLVAVLVGASSLVSLVNPFLIRAIMDMALPERRTALLTVLALGMVVVSVANSSFSVSQTYLSTKVGQRVMHDLRTAVYAHLQRMSLAFFTRTRTGEVQSRIANDIGGMQSTVTNTATTLVSNLTTVVATIIAMVVLDWRLTIASLVMMPLFVWVSRRVGTERRRLTGDRQRQLATISSIVHESLSVSGILLGHTMGRSQSLATPSPPSPARSRTWRSARAWRAAGASRRSRSSCPPCPRSSTGWPA
jgi:ATP-binding cassette, subfamily B, bacterial